jgi:effector-binding domain-containing protein
MRRIWLTLAFVILVLGVFLYTYFGGFEDPVITVTNSKSFTIAGFSYEGQMNDKAFGNNFRKADSLVNNKIVTGKVAGYFYNQPKQGEDKIKAFVGVIVDDTTVTSISNLQKKTFPERKVVQAVIEAHYMIMPVNIYPKIQEFAKEKNLKISEESVEIYESDKKLVIQVPVKL